jgi:hypothetical protein
MLTILINRGSSLRSESDLLDEYGRATRSRPTSIRRPSPREAVRRSGVDY